MDYYAGVDVSLKEAAVCILDAAGQVICEQKVASEPDALTRFFRGLDFQVSRIGLEAGPLSQWLFASLTASGIGRAHVWNPVTNSPLVCRLMLENKKKYTT